MSFQQIPGQTRAKQLLQNSLRQGKVSHAYIFAGPSGTGRRQMARTFAQAMYCETLVDDACGTCLSCRKVEHGNHPELFLVEPDGASIKIDQIRQLQQQFAYRSAGAGTKIYIIHEADRMTVQAANSLLKFLEEPLSPAVAILVTENGQALLPTIQSRSQWVTFTPMQPEEMEKALTGEGLPPDLVRCAVQLTSGLESARTLSQLNEFAETRNAVLQLMKEAVSKLPIIGSIQQKVIKTGVNDRVELLLDMIILWLKDMIHVCTGKKERVVFQDQLDWMSSHAFSRSAGTWVGYMEKTVESRKRIRANANAQLVLEQLFIAVQQGERLSG
ncbi:DNA polymerase III subunit delta' [Paenibacillus koleovorans]|uniref:DNA polymerase III subunit delta' n=1 Tax=Paenibacillus koleovorans TaxID=121608 RepID=UPI000FD9BC82|nr:DNA polymerase III subunit delta' [Paenibacillus koleovorans]